MDLISLSHQSLRRVHLLQSLPDHEIEWLRQHCEFRYYDPKQIILEAGEAGDSVYLVVRGLVRVSLCGSSGDEMVFRDISDGQFFGELAGFGGGARCASVRATLPTTVAVVPAQVFGELLDRCPAVARKLLEGLAAVVADLTVRMFELGTYNVRKRIYAELLRMAERRRTATNKAVISPPPLHADIAARVGTHREAVTKELSRLARAGIIEKRKGAIEIRGLEQLEGLLERAA